MLNLLTGGRMALFLHKVHPIFFNSITKPKFHRFLQIVSDDPQNRDNIVTSICNSFGKDSRWETLTEKFSSIPLNSTLVQEVLIQLKDPENAKNALAFFHWSTKHMDFNHGVLSYCLTIHILAKAKLVRDAKALLESILKSPYTDEGVNSLQEGSVSENLSAKDGSQLLCLLESLIASYEIVDSLPLVYDLFVQTCAKLRMIDEILDACEILAGNGFGLSIVSYNTLLHVIQRSEKCHLVWNVYEQMLGNRVNPSEVTFRIMVSAMGKEGKLGRFLDVVERMNGKRCTSPGLLVNTCLVFGIIEEGRIDEGLILLKRLSQKNMILDTNAFSLVVFAKVKMGDLHAAREVYDEMLKRGFEGNPVVTTCFIVAYCEAGWTKEALALIQEMESLDIKPYDEMFNHLIDGCSKIGYLDGNLKFCERMVKMEFLPDKSTFEKMLEMLIANGEVKTADDILTSLIDKGIVPDETTYSLLVTSYAKISDAEGVLKRYHEMEYRSISPSSSTFCAIVACLHQTGRAKEACKYLLRMKAKANAPQSNS